ncbi:hypothetical protein TNCV_385361 [Trichonephila clavipes]|nr:hypothetical protein TNCV_385361 [Trichonephila clavipes]
MIVGSMGTTNHLKTWGCKPGEVDENPDHSHREDEQDSFLEICCGRAYCLNTSMAQNILFSYSTSSELLQGVPASAYQNVRFMHDGALAHFSITTPVDTAEDPTTRIIFATADIGSTPDLFERVRQLSSFVVSCAVAYAAAT